MSPALRRWLFVALFGVAGLLLALIVVLASLYWASQQAPEFYQKAIQADPAREATASDQMLQETTALASDVRHEGAWQGVFTAEQINGWLAVDLERNHPGMIPAGASDPRVSIKPEELIVACHYQAHGIQTVLWLSVDTYLAEPNVVALRIKKARAGLLPLPLDQVLDTVSLAAQRLDLHLEWRQSDGDPVALLTIPPQRAGDDKQIRVESMKLADGEVYLAGVTEPVKRPSDAKP